MATGLRTERYARGQIERTFERSTGETVNIQAPVNLYDDFEMGLADIQTGFLYAVDETGSATVGCGTDASGESGVVEFLQTDVDEDQTPWLSFGNDLRLGVGTTTTTKYAQFECRAKITTLGGTSKGLQAFVGLMSDIPTLNGTGGPEAATVCAGFLLGQDPEDDADDDSIFAYSDDTATNISGGTDTTVDWVTDVWQIFRIDFSDKAAGGSLRFYIDDVEYVNTGHDFDTLTAAEAIMQPSFGFVKHTTEADNNWGALRIDYWRFWSIR